MSEHCRQDRAITAVIGLSETRDLPRTLVMLMCGWLALPDLGNLAQTSKAACALVQQWLTCCQALNVDLSSRDRAWAIAFGLAHQHCAALRHLRLVGTQIRSATMTDFVAVLARIVANCRASLRTYLCGPRCCPPMITEALIECRQLEEFRAYSLAPSSDTPPGALLQRLVASCPGLTCLELREPPRPDARLLRAADIDSVLAYPGLHLKRLGLSTLLSDWTVRLAHLEAPSFVGLEALTLSLHSASVDERMAQLQGLGATLGKLPRLGTLELFAVQPEHHCDVRIAGLTWRLPGLTRLVMCGHERQPLSYLPLLECPGLEQLDVAVESGTNLVRLLLALNAPSLATVRNLQKMVGDGCPHPCSRMSHEDAAQLVAALGQGAWPALEEWSDNVLLIPPEVLRALLADGRPVRVLRGVMDAALVGKTLDATFLCQLLCRGSRLEDVSVSLARLAEDPRDASPPASSLLVPVCPPQVPSQLSEHPRLRVLSLDLLTDATLAGIRLPALRHLLLRGRYAEVGDLRALVEQMPALIHLKVLDVARLGAADGPVCHAASLELVLRAPSFDVLPTLRCLAPRLATLALHNGETAELLRRLPLVSLPRLEKVWLAGCEPIRTANRDALCALLNPRHFPALRVLRLPQLHDTSVLDSAQVVTLLRARTRLAPEFELWCGATQRSTEV